MKTEDQNESTFVQLAHDRKPEDFKTAVTGAIQDRLRDAIADRRVELGGTYFNSPVEGE